MKRTAFERYLRVHSCVLVREGARHTIYQNTENGEYTVVGRHTELYPKIVRKMCKDLGIPAPREK